MKFKFESGLLSFDKMNDPWMDHRESELIHKISGDPLKNPSKITDYA